MRFYSNPLHPLWSRLRGSLPAPWEEGPGSTASSWSLGSNPDQGWLFNGGKYYYLLSVWMQSLVELAPYRWCGSHPEQDELPDQDGLSAVASSALPGWTSQLGAAMLVKDPLLCWYCPTGQGCQPSPWQNSSFMSQQRLGEVPGEDHPAPPQFSAAQLLPSTIRDTADTGQEHS